MDWYRNIVLAIGTIVPILLYKLTNKKYRLEVKILELTILEKEHALTEKGVSLPTRSKKRL